MEPYINPAATIGGTSESLPAADPAIASADGAHTQLSVHSMPDHTEQVNADLLPVPAITQAEIEALAKNNKTTHALVTGAPVNQSGLLIRIGHIPGFLPRSECDLVGNLASYVGETIPVKVLRTTPQKRGVVHSVIVSHKAANAELKLEFLKGLKRGDTVRGVVNKIVLERPHKDAPGAPRQELGATVLVNGLVQGFVYRTEVSFNRGAKPSELLPVGTEVEATVLSVDLKKIELKLSTKKHIVNHGLLGALKPGDRLHGRISHIRKERQGDNSRKRLFEPGDENGLGVDLPQGMTGYIHRFEVSTNRSVKPSTILPVGTEVETEVVSVDERLGTVKLSLRPMREQELEGLRQQKGQQVTGTVRSVFPNVGYFVRLGLLTEGLLHNKDMRTENGESETLTVGTKIAVRIKDVTEDRERRRTTVTVEL